MVPSHNLKHNFVPRRDCQRRKPEPASTRPSHDWSLSLETDITAQRAFQIPLLSTTVLGDNNSNISADHCSFYSLLGELRNEIYTLALESDKFGWEQAGPTRSPPLAVRSLSHVSRLVRAELSAMYYAQHNF